MINYDHSKNHIEIKKPMEVEPGSTDSVRFTDWLTFSHLQWLTDEIFLDPCDRWDRMDASG